MSTENIGGQFRGWLNPATAGGVNRPERKAQGAKPAKDNHRGIISAELTKHPKKIGFGMFSRGLTSMGVGTDKKTLAHIAGLVTSNNEQFHQLVAMARKNAIGEKQSVAQNRKK